MSAGRAAVPTGARTWLDPAWKALWARPVLDRDAYAQLGNVKQVLRALYVLLSASEHTPQLEVLREKLLEVVVALQ